MNLSEINAYVVSRHGQGTPHNTGISGKGKVGVVMHEFKKGTLHSGKSEKKVTKRSQAVAIALNEARKHGACIPKKPGRR